MTWPKRIVLVVEDEALVRMALVDPLAEAGFEVLDAPDADEAIRLLNAHPEIRVMFTDIDMPGSMDGLKLAAAVRDRWPPVKIVVTSGHRTVQAGDMPEHAQFFAKPYDLGEIAAVMRTLAD